MPQINITDEGLDKFIDLARRCGLTSDDDLNATFDYAFSVLKIAVEAEEQGKRLAIIHPIENTITYIQLPVSDKIRARQETLRPNLKVVK